MLDSQGDYRDSTEFTPLNARTGSDALCGVSRGAQCAVLVALLGFMGATIGLGITVMNQDDPVDQAIVAVECLLPEAQTSVPAQGMYAHNRQRAMDNLLAMLGGNETVMESSIVYLQGARMEQTFFADTERLFRQESNFLYMCQYEFPYDVGTTSAECVITAEQILGEWIYTSWLFVEKPTPYYTVWDWNGVPNTLEDLRRDYQVDFVFWREDMEEKLQELQGISRVYTLPGADLTLSAGNATLLSLTADDDATMFLEAVGNARKGKSDAEVALIATSTKLSCLAHNHVMRKGGNGGYQWEYQISADFRMQTGSCGQDRQAYLSICPADVRTAILHYNENLERVDSGRNDMVLIDAGSEGHGYGTDVTRTWPTTGRYTEEQRVVYETVLYAQDVALHGLAVGAPWDELSYNASLAILQGLRQAGLVVGSWEDNVVEQMWNVFMPHGLGHNLGIDVHDPGYGQAGRLLEEGAVFTVEPGFYFMNAVIEPALEDPNKAALLDTEVLARYQSAGTSLGGVRIEDVAVVTTEGGWELLSGDSPRTVADVENFIATGDYTYDPMACHEQAAAAYERFVAQLAIDQPTDAAFAAHTHFYSIPHHLRLDTRPLH